MVKIHNSSRRQTTRIHSLFAAIIRWRKYPKLHQRLSWCLLSFSLPPLDKKSATRKLNETRLCRLRNPTRLVFHVFPRSSSWLFLLSRKIEFKSSSLLRLCIVDGLIKFLFVFIKAFFAARLLSYLGCAGE
jgi:hypothetical protein